MCARTNLTASGEELAAAFELLEVPDLAPRYNIAPSQPMAVVRLDAARRRRRLSLMSWGVAAPGGRRGGRVINARAESAGLRGPFREAFRQRRCLVPVTGFFEWRHQGDEAQPFLVRRRDGRPFGLGALWQPEPEEAESCAILTTAPNELIAPLHDRMPLILDPAAYAVWLDTGQDDAREVQELLRPAPAGSFEAYPVSPRVNRPEYDDPSCLEPIADAGPRQGSLW